MKKTGGTPVFPYQPAGIWSEATFGQKNYEQDTGEALYRRTLYTFWRRIVGPTMLFDNSTRQVCSVNPQRTNTPLHALVTLNDVTYVEASRKLAERMLAATNDDLERLQHGYRLATSRYPAEGEAAILMARVDSLRGVYAQYPDEASRLLHVGEAAADTSFTSSEVAAWTGIGAILLNLDETLSKQ